MAIIKIPFSALDEQDGVAIDATIKKLADQASRSGSEIDTDEETEITSFTVKNGLLHLTTAIVVKDKGGVICKYPLFLKVEKTDLIPAGFINSEKIDMEGVSQGQKTWSEWAGGDEKFVEIASGDDAGSYIGTNASTGKDIDFDELDPLFDFSDIPTGIPAILAGLKTVKEMKQIILDNAPDPE